MEPICKDKNFTSILKSWKFIACYHEYLQISPIAESLSLYDYQRQICHNEFYSTFQQTLIKGIVNRCDNTKEPISNYATLLGLLPSPSEEDGQQIRSKLIDRYAYELGLSYVDVKFRLQGDIDILEPSMPFHQIKDKFKFRYLEILIEIVSNSQNFQTYLKQLHTNPEIKDKNHILKSQICLGFDHLNNIYFFFTQINDRVFIYSTQKDQWSYVLGKPDIVQMIKQFLSNKDEHISVDQLILIENLSNIKSKIKTQSYAFKKSKSKIEKAQTIDSLSMNRQLILQTQKEYSKFAADCFNSRWASKNYRKDFIQKVKEANDIAQLKSLLIQFFHQTKFKNFAKKDQLQPYDYSLETEDINIEQFRLKHLRCNYIYMKTLGANNQSVNSCLKDITQQESHPAVYYIEPYMQLLLMAVLTFMRKMYVKFSQSHQRLIKRLEQIKRKQEEEKNRPKLIVKHHHFMDSDDNDSNTEDTTVENNRKSDKIKNGRRLRNVQKVSYKMSNIGSSSASTSKIRMSIKNKNCNMKKRSQPVRGAKLKSKKMQMDSETETESESQPESESEISSSKQSQIGVSIQQFEYKRPERTSQNVRMLRSSGRQ